MFVKFQIGLSKGSNRNVDSSIFHNFPILILIRFRLNKSFPSLNKVQIECVTRNSVIFWI